LILSPLTHPSLLWKFLLPSSSPFSSSSRERGFKDRAVLSCWIPAFAGMTHR
jgi:hypothetical protein